MDMREGGVGEGTWERGGWVGGKGAPTKAAHVLGILEEAAVLNARLTRPLGATVLGEVHPCVGRVGGWVGGWVGREEGQAGGSYSTCG